MHSTGTYKITTQAAPNRKIIRTYMTTKSYAHKLEKYPSIGESNMIFPNNILQLVYAIPSSDQHTFQKTSCSWSMPSNILINILFRQHFVVVLICSCSYPGCLGGEEGQGQTFQPCYWWSIWSLKGFRFEFVMFLRRVYAGTQHTLHTYVIQQHTCYTWEVRY